jgi:hypothetical protein
MPKRALTDDDIKLLHETFATKDELKEVKSLVAHLPTKTEFYTAMDKIMGEIKAMREELAIVTGYEDKIEDHEDRITAVEKKLITSAN